MYEIAKVLFGAVIGFAAAILGERLKRIHTSRTSALMVIRELEFHQQRLNLAIMQDQGERPYSLLFSSPIWTAQGAALLAGAATRETEAILNWYASMAVLGFVLSNGVGPDRARLQAALSDAHKAAGRIAVRWTLRKRAQRRPSLFDDVAH